MNNSGSNTRILGRRFKELSSVHPAGTDDHSELWGNILRENAKGSHAYLTEHHLRKQESCSLTTYKTILCPPTTLLPVTVVILLLWKYVISQRFLKAHGRLSLPPGPRGYPIIGSLFDMPSEKAWLVYDRWFKVYGEVVYFKVLGQGYLLLGSSTATTDLFEKRSTKYSDRPEMPMVVDLMGWDFNLAFMRYSPWWRRHRRAFHGQFHAGVVARYQPIQFREAHAFLRRLLTSPDNWMHHIRHAFAAIIMDISYGIKVADTDDPYILNAEEALRGLAEAGMPGQFLVDLIPVLKHVPNWFPGAGFKRKAAHWRKVNYDMVEKPFNYVKNFMGTGLLPQSLTTKLIEALPAEQDENRADQEQIAKNAVGVAYAGGADTTVSAVQSLFLAMAMYPDVQQRAQAEIDSVVGPDRLPDFGDREFLPYINAMVKETMRWQPVLPLGVGHMCSSDDEYRGYFIPEGTLVLGNSWTILHNPEVYPSPEEYTPERWLKDGQLNPAAEDPTAAFGFGRRICPGRHLSDNSLYIMIAHILSVFNIAPPLDDQGKSVHLQPNPTSGLLSYPAPFGCTIKPRSRAAEALINGSST